MKVEAQNDVQMELCMMASSLRPNPKIAGAADELSDVLGGQKRSQATTLHGVAINVINLGLAHEIMIGFGALAVLGIENELQVRHHVLVSENVGLSQIEVVLSVRISLVVLVFP